MKIKILKIDFRKGARGDCGTCPVARGCLRASRPLGYDYVRVSGSTVDFWRGGARYETLRRRDLPNAAQVVIADFDVFTHVSPLKGHYAAPRSDFDPFQFEIEDLPRAQGSVFTIPGQYAIDPKSGKATRRLRKFVVT